MIIMLFWFTLNKIMYHLIGNSFYILWHYINESCPLSILIFYWSDGLLGKLDVLKYWLKYKNHL